MPSCAAKQIKVAGAKTSSSSSLSSRTTYTSTVSCRVLEFNLQLGKLINGAVLSSARLCGRWQLPIVAGDNLGKFNLKLRCCGCSCWRTLQVVHCASLADADARFSGKPPLHTRTVSPAVQRQSILADKDGQFSLFASSSATTTTFGLFRLPLIKLFLSRPVKCH